MTNIVQFDFDELRDVIRTTFKEAIRELNVNHQEQDLPDRMGIKEALEITGLKKATIYKLTMDGTIPHEKFRNGRLVFSRKELEEWMQQQTIRKQTPEEIATTHLAEVARKRINKG